jgi:hypothetical protein
MRTVAIVLPRISAEFMVDDRPIPRVGTTNADGIGTIQLSDLPVTRVVVDAKGFKPYAAEAVQLPPGNIQIRIGVAADPSRPNDVLLPALTPLPPPVPHLEVRGNDFVDRNGRRTVLCGCDGFDDYRFWLDAREDKVGPFLEESQKIKAVVRRVFLMGDAIENNVFTIHPLEEPNFHEQLVPFVAFENAHGCIPLLTVNADAQRAMPDAHDRLRHWQRIAATLRQSGLAYLLSAGNEHDKNGYDPNADVDDPGPGVIWSRGSSLEDKQTPPRGAVASELHATRISFDRTLEDAVASPHNMRAVSGSGMCWMTEGIPVTQTTDPFLLWKYGRALSVEWALGILHDRQGQRGQLRTGAILESAIAFGEGMAV